MNIYEKLQTVRVALQNKNLKKGKTNTYSGYQYYELADFLPELMQLMNDNKMTSVISFTNELATLTLIDMEKPDAQIIFTSPMSTAKLKAAHEIQNLGAVETYERRYLYMMAFEIVEADVLDATQGQIDTTPQQNVNKDANWCAPAAGNMFVVDLNNPPKAELERLWQFANWDISQLAGYIQNWSVNKKIQVMDDTAYKALLNEQLQYLKNEKHMAIEIVPF